MRTEGENEIEKTTVKLPTVVTIVVAIIFYFGTLAGLYFKLQSNVEKANATAEEASKVATAALAKSDQCQENLNAMNTNNALIKYQLDELKVSISQLNSSTNEIYKLVRNR